MKAIERVMLVSMLVASSAYLTSAGATAVSTLPSRPTISNAVYILDVGVWTANAIRERELVGPGSVGPGWLDVRNYGSAKTLLGDIKAWISGSSGYYLPPNAQLPNYKVDLPPEITPSNLVVWTMAPTNYFDSTPFKTLFSWPYSTQMVGFLTRIKYGGAWEGDINSIIRPCEYGDVITGGWGGPGFFPVYDEWTSLVGSYPWDYYHQTNYFGGARALCYAVSDVEFDFGLPEPQVGFSLAQGFVQKVHDLAPAVGFYHTNSITIIINACVYREEAVLPLPNDTNSCGEASWLVVNSTSKKVYSGGASVYTNYYAYEFPVYTDNCSGEEVTPWADGGTGWITVVRVNSDQQTWFNSAPRFSEACIEADMGGPSYAIGYGQDVTPPTPTVVIDWLFIYK